MKILILFCLVWAQTALGQTNLSSTISTSDVAKVMDVESGWLMNPFPSLKDSTTGQVRIVECQFVPWTNSAGVEVSTIRLGVDMNGRKQARLMMARSDARGYDYVPGGTVVKIEFDWNRRLAMFYTDPSTPSRLFTVHSPN